MNFRTEISLSASGLNLNHDSRFVCLGSCFARTIGQKLINHKFKVNLNPFGVIYNPLSLFSLLQNTLDDHHRIEPSIVSLGPVYTSLLTHSDISHSSEQKLIALYDARKKQLQQDLKRCDVLVISLGSAFIYRHIEKELDVANCHKLPGHLFEKRRLSPQDILDSFAALHSALMPHNPNIKIMFTVSPIRHTREGLANNNLSKSILRVAVEELVEQYDDIHYFPSYEIMLDDLRDYRYYKEDLIHPTEFAENYIWNLFKNHVFDEKTITLIEDWKKLSNELNHKPFYPQSQEHQAFLKKLLQKLELFDKKIDCSKEIEFVKSQLLS